MQGEPNYNPFHTDSYVASEIMRQESDVSTNYSRTELCAGIAIGTALAAYLLKKALVDPQNSKEK